MDFKYTTKVLHMLSKINTLINLKGWYSEEILPEFQSIFGAVIGVVLHVVKETEEILQTLKADLRIDTNEKQERQRDWYLHKDEEELRCVSSKYFLFSGRVTMS